MASLLYAFLVSVALAPLPSDTPPSKRIPPPAISSLRTLEDVRSAARLENGNPVPRILYLPQLRNSDQLMQHMRDNYPASASRARTQAIAWVFIDARGQAFSDQIIVSSGSSDLDSLALAMIRIARFDPAQLSFDRVAVWVPLPVDLTPDPPRRIRPPLSSEPVFTPYTEAPELVNRGDVSRKLVEVYPHALRNAGVGGTVLLWVLVDENGEVGQVRVKQSDLAALDEPAMEVARIMRFVPAKNRDVTVPVWIQLPIVFRASVK